MGAAASSARETAGVGSRDEEQECRICRHPAEPERPLRHPCACRGTIRFMMMLFDALHRFEPFQVCNHGISARLLYATDAPARLPISEFIVGLPDRLTGLLLPLIFAVCVVPEFTIHIGTLWSWRLALARSFDEAHYLLSLRLSTASVLGLFALWVAFAYEYMPFAVAPFFHWVACLEARRQGFGGFDGSQILALFAVEAFLVVVMFDLALACVLVFLPFSLGRIVLWCILCSDSCNVGEVNSYTSTASVLLIGYGFIISVGVIYAGLYIFGQYLRGKRLVIAAFITSLSGIFLTGITCFTSVASFCLNTLHGLIIYPLFFGWSLDICTSKMFGATMSQRLELMFAASFASTALHCLIGFEFLYLHGLWSTLLHKIFRPGVAVPTFDYDINIDEPFYKFYFNKPHHLLHGILYMAAVIFVPVQIADRLAPELFPLNITDGYLTVRPGYLLALVVGFGVVVTTIGASRDAFAYMTKGRTHLRNLSQALIVFLWLAIVPFLIGSLVDLLLIPSPTGPDDEVSLFYTWFLGFRSLRIWVKLAHETRDTPFLAYFIDERWSPKIVRFAAGSRSGKVRLRFFLRELFMPIATRLLPALCIPYVLAKGVFPRFGYSAAMNSAVYRFAWLGTLGPCALCYISKLLCTKLHDSIRDERYVIGQRQGRRRRR
ncbi:probable E3 ubiquitin ligase SUD1 [Triticum urartu]|uniref:probable E3 ubiquitin ligase SUD1 n=1 Tax=Triticum urartu TaxID=4572 RepID=UPI00204355CA|nr:probable E3 ubiquitin ligase SUD1 [Triticum urartu]